MKKYKTAKLLNVTLDNIKAIQNYYLNTEGIVIPRGRIVHIAVQGILKKIIQKNNSNQNDNK